MFDKLLEKIKIADEIEANLATLLEKKTWEEIAKALYSILDDISTADDMCKENAKAFRNMVMKLQSKKNQYLASYDGQTVVRVDEKNLWRVYYKDYTTDPYHPEEVEMKKRFPADTEQEACQLGQELLNKEAPGGEWEVVRAEKLRPNENHSIGDKHNTTPLLESIVSCLACGQDMGESDTCTVPYVGIGSYYYKRNTSYFDVNERCHDCGILNEEGNVHHQNCDIERCPRCGKQNISCSCNRFGKEYLEELPEGGAAREAKTVVQESKDKGYKDLFRLLSKGSKKVVCPECGEIILVQKAELPKIVKCPECGWKKRVDENLTAHAQKELELAGLFDKDSDYEGMLGEAVMELVQKFAEQGHSGFSAARTIAIFDKVANWKPLTELTNNSDEWGAISEEMNGGNVMWQSKRSPSCFSEDGGKTYWDIDEDYYVREDGLSPEEWDNRPIHTSKHVENE